MNKKINLEIRREIEKLISENNSISEISKKLKIYRSTIYRDIKKCSGNYSAEEAEIKTSKGYHPIDLEIIGRKFGKLTILEYTNHIKNHRTFWKALCDCGEITYISRKILADYCSPDRELSCGCVAKQGHHRDKFIPIEEAALRKYQDLLNFREIKGDCWIWKGYLQKGLVPKTSWKCQAMSVRKCMFLLINGIVCEPEATYASCRNRLCFNPEHIKLGNPPKKQWYLD